MRSLIIPAFAICSILIGNAAVATINQALEIEAIEMCHRDGGTPETCGDLPLDDL